MAITRHSNTVGYSIPARRKRSEVDKEVLWEDRSIGVGSLMPREYSRTKLSPLSNGGDPAKAMTDQKRLVLDANILLRAFFGVRVRSPISEKRRIDPGPGILVFNRLPRLIEVVDRRLYEEYETSAREGMISLDEEYWSIVATPLLSKCAVWTKDRNFIGSGISTWTTDTVGLYLQA